ncbi:hypothetical protein BV25DRAFT_1313242 [Artomyces pyxidatus]|uniref:Uncharacterized protein n=1 Tax=Artomyces pyxidatus TaxID=48021 RepID=A0ACB8SPE2_9AGAM|nr:hypothetical protein BV25DRAFT_1313242 [Artomyces pyxidatus]
MANVSNKSTVVSSVLTTTSGFHTTSLTQLSIFNAPASSCTLKQVYTLPPLLFVDPYELHHYEDSYSFEVSGTSNLEAPVFAMDKKDTILLLNILLSDLRPEHVLLLVTLPLHMRYGYPTLETEMTEGFVNVTLSPPVTFWSCSHSSPVPLPENLRGAFAAFPAFRSSAALFVVPPAEGGILTPHTIRIPVGHLEDARVVEFSTVATILLAFVYLIRIAVRSARSPLEGGRVKEE